MDTNRIEKVRNQVKSKWYYIFWGAMSLSVVTMCGVIAYSNFTLAESQDKMAREVRSYLMVKPFPLLCRDGTYIR
jgi:hypothetical protein